MSNPFIKRPGRRKEVKPPSIKWPNIPIREVQQGLVDRHSTLVLRTVRVLTNSTTWKGYKLTEVAVVQRTCVFIAVSVTGHGIHRWTGQGHIHSAWMPDPHALSGTMVKAKDFEAKHDQVRRAAGLIAARHHYLGTPSGSVDCPFGRYEEWRRFEATSATMRKLPRSLPETVDSREHELI